MRLIDADAFERRCMFDSNIEDMQDVIYALRDYPTVCDIEQIRAEIAEYKDDKVIHAEQNEMIDIVLEIIDKYTKGESKW